MIEYIARGPLSNERLEITPAGHVKLRLKTKWTDGTTHLLFTPGEFLEKLAALVPPPRRHLVRWGGVFAPNSPYRKDITLRPHIKKGSQFDDDTDDGARDGERRPNRTWSKMLARVFKIDVTKCPSCGGKMVLICAVTERRAIKRYLEHVGIDADPPARAPPRQRDDVRPRELPFRRAAESPGAETVDVWTD